MAYSNSSLVSYTKLSPNHSGQRTHSIDRITPHCVVGQLTAESICGCFTSPSREASCNYGIGKDGKIALCVEEKNRSWCSSSSANDQRAVTIECASDLNHPYAMTIAVYNSLVKLCTDICKRNGKKKLLWLGDKTKTLNYSPKSDEMVLTRPSLVCKQVLSGRLAVFPSWGSGLQGNGSTGKFFLRICGFGLIPRPQKLVRCQEPEGSL